eukprot:GGOE01013589.1.p2 GENE.GGOE01013589.1~~GGOE01013589.1.p2  ORF type:complete len:179 (-),score=8.42 GGOE01013589.1:183-719(-)
MASSPGSSERARVALTTLHGRLARMSSILIAMDRECEEVTTRLGSFETRLGWLEERRCLESLPNVHPACNSLDSLAVQGTTAAIVHDTVLQAGIAVKGAAAREAVSNPKRLERRLPLPCLGLDVTDLAQLSPGTSSPEAITMISIIPPAPLKSPSKFLDLSIGEQARSCLSCKLGDAC